MVQLAVRMGKGFEDWDAERRGLKWQVETRGERRDASMKGNCIRTEVVHVRLSSASSARGTIQGGNDDCEPARTISVGQLSRGDLTKSEHDIKEIWRFSVYE